MSPLGDHQTREKPSKTELFQRPVPGLCQKELQGPEMLGNLGARVGAPAGVPPIPGGKSPQRLPEPGPRALRVRGEASGCRGRWWPAEGLRRQHRGL